MYGCSTQVVKQLSMNDPAVSLTLRSIDADKRTECVRILKKSFELPLQQILALVDAAPCEIAKVKPKSKAENLKKCLAKHGIVLDLAS